MAMRGLSSIELSIGETRNVYIRLRHLRSGGFINLNGVDSIEVEAALVTDATERTLPPIICDRNAPEADWVNGLIVVPFSPSNVTARPGTYDYNVLVWNLEGENPVFEGGRQEVKNRSRIEKWVRPDDGAYWTDNVRSGKAAQDMPAGTPVTFDDITGILTPAMTTVHGVLLAPAVAGYAALYARSGWVSRADWSGVFTDIVFPPHETIGIGLTPGSLIAPPVGPAVGVSDVTGTRLTFGPP